MSAVIVKELKDFFNTKKGWFLSGGFLLINGFFMTVYHFYFGNTRYEILLGSMLTAWALLFPVWAIGRFEAERKEGADRFWQLLPVSPAQVFAGKVLASVLLFGGLTLILGLCPILLSFFGGTSFLSAYVSLAAFFLLGCAVMFGEIALALVFRRTLWTWILSYAVPVLLFVLARCAEFFDGWVETLLSCLSLFGSFRSFSYAVLDWRMLILGAALAALFLAVCFFLYQRKTGAPLAKLGVLSGALSVILIGLTVGTSFLPAYVLKQDMSEEKVLSFSDTTKTFLKALDEDVTVYLLDDEASNREGNGYEDIKFEYFLEKYVSYSKHLTLKRIPIEESETLLAELGLTQADVYQYCAVFKSEKRSELLNYMNLLSYSHNNASLYALGLPYEFSYSDYSRYASALASLVQSDSSKYASYYAAFYNDVQLCFYGEALMNTVVEYVTADLIPQKYVLTGHGEANPSDLALGEILTDVVFLNLSEVTSIPEDASAILMLAPQSDYSEAEIQVLSDYLNRGGTLNVVTDENNLSMPNLMGLLDRFGLRAESGKVHAEEEVTTKQEDGSETTETKVSDSVLTSANVSSDVLADLASLGEDATAIRITGGNALSFHENGDSSLLTEALLTTSDKAFIGDRREEKASYVLAASAENNRGMHLTWFTGAESFLLRSDAVREDLESVYALFCPYLAMNWSELTYTSELPKVPAVAYDEPYLQAEEAHMWIFGILLIVVIPASFAAVGIIRTYRRKKA